MFLVNPTLVVYLPVRNSPRVSRNVTRRLTTGVTGTGRPTLRQGRGGTGPLRDSGTQVERTGPRTLRRVQVTGLESTGRLFTSMVPRGSYSPVSLPHWGPFVDLGVDPVSLSFTNGDTRRNCHRVACDFPPLNFFTETVRSSGRIPVSTWT